MLAGERTEEQSGHTTHLDGMNLRLCFSFFCHLHTSLGEHSPSLFLSTCCLRASFSSSRLCLCYLFFHRRSRTGCPYRFPSHSLPLCLRTSNPTSFTLVHGGPSPPTIACTYYQKNSISQNVCIFFPSSSYRPPHPHYIYLCLKKTAEIPAREKDDVHSNAYQARFAMLIVNHFNQSRGLRDEISERGQKWLFVCTAWMDGYTVMIKFGI
jgi:hypothetical protein